jgi:hypothetical protein
MPRTSSKTQKARRAAAEGGSQRVANVEAAAALAALPGASGGAGQQVRQSSNGYLPPLPPQGSRPRAQAAGALQERPGGEVAAGALSALPDAPGGATTEVRQCSNG